MLCKKVVFNGLSLELYTPFDFSTSVILVFRTVIVTKPFISDIFLSTSPIFFLNFLNLCFIDLYELN